MKQLFENWKRYLNETVGLEDNPDLSQDGFQTAKKPIPLEFRYAETDETIETKEGSVGAKAGDAIMTGTEGELHGRFQPRSSRKHTTTLVMVDSSEEKHTGICQRNERTISKSKQSLVK